MAGVMLLEVVVVPSKVLRMFPRRQLRKGGHLRRRESEKRL